MGKESCTADDVDLAVESGDTGIAGSRRHCGNGRPRAAGGLLRRGGGGEEGEEGEWEEDFDAVVVGGCGQLFFPLAVDSVTGAVFSRNGNIAGHSIL